MKRIVRAAAAAYLKTARFVGPGVESRAFLCSAILFQAAVVAFLASHHDRRFSFDESNTIRISKLPAEDIAETLSHDQNFNLYYQLLHLGLASPGTLESLSVWFNYACWCAAIFVFHRITKKLFESGRWRLFATLLYTAAPSIFYYAFYVRMYALANLAYLLALLCLLQYYEREKIQYLLAHWAALILIAFLHPTAAVIGGTLWIAQVLSLRNRRHLRVVCAMGFLGAVILCTEVLEKVDPIKTYLGTGIQYVKETSHHFFNVPSQLIFRQFYDWSWIFYILVVVLVTAYACRGGPFRRQRFVLTVFCAVLALLHMLVRSFANGHHYYFFVAPLLLVMLLGLKELSSLRPSLQFLVPLTVLLFGAHGLGFLIHQLKFERDWRALSGAMKDLEPGLVLTDYTMSNAIEEGSPPGKHKVVLLAQDKLFDTTGLSVKEMLIAQARLGGTPTPGMASNAYRSMLRALTRGDQDRLKHGLETLAEGRTRLYYVTSFNRLELYPEELELLNHYRFLERRRPSIFCFAAIPEVVSTQSMGNSRLDTNVSAR